MNATLDTTDLQATLWQALCLSHLDIQNLPHELVNDLQGLVGDFLDMKIDDLLDNWGSDAHDERARSDWADGLPSVYTHAAFEELAGVDAVRWMALMDDTAESIGCTLDGGNGVGMGIWGLWAAAYSLTAEQYASVLADSLLTHLDELVPGELGQVADAYLYDMPTATLREVLEAARDTLAVAA